MPAMETRKVPYLRFLNLRGFIGTGFAHPKRMGEDMSIRRAGRIIVPKRSMWGMGFRVSLPAYLAVGSPIL